MPKHRGRTYFGVDMTSPHVEVLPLRQATGEAELNEVFLTDVRIPDRDRIGAVGNGWRVATSTLMNERVAIGGQSAPREGGMLGVVAMVCRERPELRIPGLHSELLELLGEDGLAYDDLTMRRPTEVRFHGERPDYSYLRS